MNTQGKTILILGGGIGGVVAASRLRKKLRPEHRVVLIEREANHVFAPSLLWLMTGLRTSEKISRPLAKLERLGIERIQGEIENIDPKQMAVTVEGQKVKGDYLVLALGAALAPETIPGLREAGHNFYTLNGAEALCESRLQLRQGAVRPPRRSGTPGGCRRILGCGPGPGPSLPPWRPGPWPPSILP